MNKKGFTTIELVISFSMVVIILGSLIGFTVTYRGKVKNEEIRSQLIDFKNTITKTIYDDIITKKYKRIEYCTGTDDCVNFIDADGNSHPLKIINVLQNNDNQKKGVYLNYDGINYLLPDSDLNRDTEYVCHFIDSFNLKIYNDSLYNLSFTYYHYFLNEKYQIMLTIN